MEPTKPIPELYIFEKYKEFGYGFTEEELALSSLKNGKAAAKTEENKLKELASTSSKNEKKSGTEENKFEKSDLEEKDHGGVERKENNKLKQKRYAVEEKEQTKKLRSDENLYKKKGFPFSFEFKNDLIINHSLTELIKKADLIKKAESNERESEEEEMDEYEESEESKEEKDNLRMIKERNFDVEKLLSVDFWKMLINDEPRKNKNMKETEIFSETNNVFDRELQNQYNYEKNLHPAGRASECERCKKKSDYVDQIFTFKNYQTIFERFFLKHVSDSRDTSADPSKSLSCDNYTSINENTPDFQNEGSEVMDTETSLNEAASDNRSRIDENTQDEGTERSDIGISLNEATSDNCSGIDENTQGTEMMDTGTSLKEAASDNYSGIDENTQNEESEVMDTEASLNEAVSDNRSRIDENTQDKVSKILSMLEKFPMPASEEFKKAASIDRGVFETGIAVLNGFDKNLESKSLTEECSLENNESNCDNEEPCEDIGSESDVKYDNNLRKEVEEEILRPYGLSFKTCPSDFKGNGRDFNFKKGVNITEDENHNESNQIQVGQKTSDTSWTSFEEDEWEKEQLEDIDIEDIKNIDLDQNFMLACGLELKEEYSIKGASENEEMMQEHPDRNERNTENNTDPIDAENQNLTYSQMKVLVGPICEDREFHKNSSAKSSTELKNFHEPNFDADWMNFPKNDFNLPENTYTHEKSPDISEKLSTEDKDRAFLNFADELIKKEKHEENDLQEKNNRFEEKFAFHHCLALIEKKTTGKEVPLAEIRKRAEKDATYDDLLKDEDYV